MRIDPSGNVSINKTNTTKKLDVSGEVMIGDKLAFSQDDNIFISSHITDGIIVNHNNGPIALEPNSTGVGKVKVSESGNVDIYKSLNIGFENNYLDVSHNSDNKYLVTDGGHGALTIRRTGGTQNRANEFLRFIGDHTTGNTFHSTYHFDCSGSTTAGNFTDLHLLFGEGDSMSSSNEVVFKYSQV